MKKMIRTRRVLTVIGCFCILAAVGISYARAEGLISREGRPGWALPYENFGRYDMRSYGENAESLGDRLGSNPTNPVWNGPADPVTYDRFGNFLLPGGNAYNLTWDMSRVGAQQQTNAGRVGTFNQLMIVTDEFSNWQTKIMLSTYVDNRTPSGLRAYFTPSTLKKSRFNGIRWDASNRKNNISLLASLNSGSKNLLGGHWESVLGDVLSVGATFVMENRGTSFYSNQDIDMTTDGLLNLDRERYFYVVVTSDSPENEAYAARVYDVQPVIDDKKVDLPKRAYVIPDIFNAYRYSVDSAGGNFTNEYLFHATNDAYAPREIEDYMYSNGSWFLDLMNSDSNNTYTLLFYKRSSVGTLGYVNIKDPNNPGDPTDRMFAGVPEDGYLEARGTDVVIYEILVPAGARKVEFLVHAANDYCIDIIACLPKMNETNLHPSFYDDPETSWSAGSWSPYYETKHCTKASGRVNDGSNDDWVKVSYDRVTGVNVYGMNMELNWRGLFVRAEINEYNVLRAYPIRDIFSDAAHSIETSRAWFVNIEKDFGRLSTGAELFNYPNDYMREWGGDFIEDNDDNNDATGGWEYPGLNFDFDGSTGNFTSSDVRFTGQPYIGYYFEEVSFGDDFNHNGIIDGRENDSSIDLPYDRDSRGQHFFAKLKPYDYSFITLGYYDIKQDELGGRNQTSYVKLEHMQRIGVFEYGLFHRTERVRDNYKSDETYQQYFGGPFLIGYNSWNGGLSTANSNSVGSYSAWNGTFNNLAYRDSWVNSTFFKTRFTLFDGLNIINNVKHDQIDRLGDLTFDGSEQQKTMNVPRTIATTAFVHKIDYEFRIADIRIIPDVYWHGIRILKERRISELSFIPQFKLVNYYTSGNIHLQDGDNHIYNYYPVIRFDYKVAPKTYLRCALQGLPGFTEVYRNRERPLEGEDRRRMFFGFETRTLYSGFNLLVTSGVRRDKRSFADRRGRNETGSTEYFITLNVETGG